MRDHSFLRHLALTATLAAGCVAEPAEDCMVTDVFTQPNFVNADLLVVIDFAALQTADDQQVFAGMLAGAVTAAEAYGQDLHVAALSTNWDDEQGLFRTATAGDGSTIKWASSDREIQRELRLLLLGSAEPHQAKGRAPIYDALHTYYAEAHDGFLREGAPLSILVVTPTDDRSGRNPIAEDDFIDWLLERQPDAVPASFSSLVGVDGTCENAEIGSQYLRATDAIGGLLHPICQLDDDDLPQRLAEELGRLKRDFTLSRDPRDAIEQAWLTDGPDRTELSRGYGFDEATRRLWFLDAPPPGSTVEVTYCAEPE